MAENGRLFNVVMIAEKVWKDRGQSEVHITPPLCKLNEVMEDITEYYMSRKGTIFVEEKGKPATKFGLKENCGR